eukprot:847833-Pyramimonas_sp.AAC.1
MHVTMRTNAVWACQRTAHSPTRRWCESGRGWAAGDAGQGLASSLPALSRACPSTGGIFKNSQKK